MGTETVEPQDIEEIDWCFPEDEEAFGNWQRKQRVDKEQEKRQERAQYYD